MTIETKYRQIYNSIEDLLADCDKQVDKGVINHGRLNDLDFIGRKFTGWSDIKNSVHNYWQEGLDIVQEMIYLVDREQQKIAPPKDVRRRKRWGEQGDEIDMDRLRGSQDPWLTTARQQVTAPKQLTLFVNIGALEYITPEEMLWRGAASICLADLLERNGYRVEIWSSSYGTDRCIFDKNKEFTFIGTKLKDVREPVDISTLVNGVSGWFYRTVIFQSFACRGIPNSGKGTTSLLTKKVDIIGEISGNSLPVVIDGVYSKEKALELISDTIAELQGEKSGQLQTI